MININSFLKKNEKELIVIINSLKEEKKESFSSHDFIEKFSKKFESDYIEMLVNYRDKGTTNVFQTVHGIIARFLSENMVKFQITKAKRGPSENVFGSNDNIHWWKSL
jgi:hypothetical protein